MQAPVWEHTAALAVGFQPKVKFAKVDCTDPKSEDLCMNQHIQAYPTIILFTSVGGVHTHEFYHGACVVLVGCCFGACWGCVVGLGGRACSCNGAPPHVSLCHR